MTNIDVSIIIVNYNTITFLCDAIDSVFQKTDGINFEIIVVDNNSTDNSKEILTAKYENKINFLGLSENVGFGRANNEGLKIAKGRNVFLLNPDTIIITDAVKILSDYLDGNPTVGICGGNLFDHANKPTISFVRVLPSIIEELNRLFFYVPFRIVYGKNIEFNYTNRPLKVAGVIGADMMIRKKVLDEVGAFDPDFFMYHEELEMAYRLKKAKYKIMSIPEAQIIHLEGKSLASNFDRKKRMLNARNLYLRKTHNILSIFVADAIFYLAAFSRLLLFKLLRNKEKDVWWLFLLKNIK